MPNPLDEPVPVDLSPEHADLLARIAGSYGSAAPAGWLRVVARQECSVDPELAGVVNVRVAVVRTADGLAQEPFRPSRDLHFETGDMLRELAEQSPTRTVVLHLVVDRDGSWSGRVEQDVPRVLAGTKDETSSTPVHEYLERNRAELEELAARLG